MYEGAKDSDKAYVREGYLGLFIYLPTVLKHKFEPYLPQALPAILEGLADETGKGKNFFFFNDLLLIFILSFIS